MPTPLYHVLETVTLTSSASSVTFSSIDQSYGDLILTVDAANDAGKRPTDLNFNSDTGSNYSYVYALGYSSFALSSSNTSQGRIRLVESGRTGTTFGTLLLFNIMDYAATDKHKSVLARGNSDSRQAVGMEAHRWASTAAITSLDVKPSSGNFIAGSTFTLYATTKAV